MATKQDYILVAEAIRKVKESIGSNDTGSEVALKRLITELGLRFQRNNSRYDHEKFIEAIYGKNHN
jgi:G:T-mismatch repair DNA endonuclease (very short patch repair protein)